MRNNGGAPMAQASRHPYDYDACCVTRESSEIFSMGKGVAHPIHERLPAVKEMFRKNGMKEG